MSITALKTLAASSKATVLVAVVAVLGVLVYLGKLDGQAMLDAVTWLVPAWMAAHAGERGAKHIADGKQLRHADVLALLSDGPPKLTAAEIDYARRRFDDKPDGSDAEPKAEP